MLPKQININIYRGDDTTIIFNVFNHLNLPLDLSTVNLNMIIAPYKGGKYPLTLGNGISVKDNKIFITFSHQLTKYWDFRDADYDLEMIDNQDIHTTIVRGTIKITKDITV